MQFEIQIPNSYFPATEPCPIDLLLDLPVLAARLKIVESVLLSVTGCKLGFPAVLQPVKSFCFES